MANQTKKYVLGADPGKHGGIALLSTKFNPVRIAKDDLILFPTRACKGKFDVAGLWEFLRPYVNRIELCVQEEVHALFGSSATGTFEFGDANGSLRTVLSLLGMISDKNKPFEVVTVQPKIWQKKAWKPEHIEYSDTSDKLGRRKKDTKATSMNAAKAIFPGISFVPKRCKIAHDGLIDAALIAYYGLHLIRA